ncbi:hypothetical protein Kpho02_26720 [Kitasatospora phosalacinea]|uniref:Uncharacterized protein n=1 Tax=Kitasatospora phosalacinea TaxID=2065 RepID=A0A9W6Q8K1_9ACTN|nr:hypothetical protein Kpho02_26720 [Kitasatospora phosalacinea]
MRELADGEPEKHSEVARVSTEALPQEFVSTTGTALGRYLQDSPGVSLDSW